MLEQSGCGLSRRDLAVFEEQEKCDTENNSLKRWCELDVAGQSVAAFMRRIGRVGACGE